MTLINMDALKESSPRTYRTVIKSLDLRETFGQVDIDLGKLSQFTRGELFGWLAAYNAKLLNQPAATPPPPAPVSKKPVEPEDAELGNRAVDETEGALRIEHYVAEGLEDTQANGSLIIDFIKTNCKGYWSASAVDAAIKTLRSRLSWKKAVKAPATPQPSPPAPPVPPQPVAPQVELLPNGEPRLSLDAVPSKHHSAVQLKDWLARTRK